ncbi:MAG: hypothetical protein ABFD20_00290 [Anaerolineales bacterium]
MAERGTWWQRVQGLLERWPVYAKGTGPQRALIVGAIVGALFSSLLGAILGMINRGLPGAIVGGISAGVTGLAIGAVVGWLIPKRKVTLGADIEIDDTREAFSAGDTISGYVVLSADGSALVHRATVRLACVGRFVYDRVAGDDSDRVVYDRAEKTYADETVVAVRQVRLHRGSQVRFPFSFTLPENALPTHYGFGCVIRWLIDLDVDAQFMIEPVRREVMVASAARGAAMGSSQASITCDAFQLSLSLPQLQYSEGDTIDGDVVIVSGGDLAIKELRVALVRVEKLAAGDGHIVYFAERDPGDSQVMGNRQPAASGTTYVWLDQHQVLAEATKMNGARQVRYPFALPLARAWRPSVSTAEASVRWQLSAVVSREGLPDVQAALRLEVYTAAPPVGRLLSRVSA